MYIFISERDRVIYNPAWFSIRILFTGFKDKQKSAGRGEETGGIPSAKKTTARNHFPPDTKSAKYPHLFGPAVPHKQKMAQNDFQGSIWTYSILNTALKTGLTGALLIPFFQIIDIRA